MEKTSKSIVAGVFSIVAGIIGLGLVALLLFSVRGALSIEDICGTGAFVLIILPSFLAVFLFICSVISIIGGIYALKRKTWGLALVGSIAAILVLFPMGILAVIFIALSKKEFE